MTITVGRIEGGWAYWCDECKRGQAAKQGVSVLDANVVDILADGHEADHARGAL